MLQALLSAGTWPCCRTATHHVRGSANAMEAAGGAKVALLLSLCLLQLFLLPRE